MKPGGLFSAASWSLTGQIGFYALQWFNMIILARLSGPEAVGLYTLGLAIANPIMAVASLMLRLVFIADTKQQWAFETYNKVRWVCLPLGVGAVILTGWMLGYHDLALIVILLAASWKMAENLSEISYGVPHKRGDMRIIALSMIMRAALSSLVLTLCLAISDRLDLSLLAFSLTWWLCYLFHDRKLSDDADQGDAEGSALSLARFAMPMALSTAVVYLTFSVPRIVLDQYQDTATLGVFAAISHLLLVGAMTVNAFGSAITPRLSRYFAQNNKRAYFSEIAIGAGSAAFIAVSFILVAYFAGDLLISLIYGETISGHGDLVFMIALAALPLYVGSFLGFVPPAVQAYRFHLIINLITVGGTSVAALLLIPPLGVSGAVYAIVVQGVLQLLNALVFFKKMPSRTTKPQTEALALEEATA